MMPKLSRTTDAAARRGRRAGIRVRSAGEARCRRAGCRTRSPCGPSACRPSRPPRRPRGPARAVPPARCRGVRPGRCRRPPVARVRTRCTEPSPVRGLIRRVRETSPRMERDRRAGPPRDRGLVRGDRGRTRGTCSFSGHARRTWPQRRVEASRIGQPPQMCQTCEALREVLLREVVGDEVPEQFGCARVDTPRRDEGRHGAADGREVHAVRPRVGAGLARDGDERTGDARVTDSAMSRTRTLLDSVPTLKAAQYTSLSGAVSAHANARAMSFAWTRGRHGVPSDRTRTSPVSTAVPTRLFTTMSARSRGEYPKAVALRRNTGQKPESASAATSSSTRTLLTA